jgi:DNA polymerase III subunit beta
MKIICQRESLSHAFQTAAAVAPSRSSKPVLQNLKLDVANSAGVLSGTDLEIGIRIGVGTIEMEAEGSVLLPIDRFGSILRESPDEKLTIETDGRLIQVRGMQSQFQLPSVNPDEFPAVPDFHEEQFHELAIPFFRELIRRTVFATDNESSRYALGGVLFELTEDRITAVATDGRRLARQEGPGQSVGGHVTGNNTVIIPTKALQLIERALADGAGTAQLAVRENDVLMRSGAATVYARLVEGRFPRWREVFPKHGEYDCVSLELPVGPFHNAVRQAAIVTSADRRGIELAFGEGRVTLAAHGAEHGESHIELPVAYDGEPLVISLDPRYLSDFLKVLSPDTTFTMELRGSKTAAVCLTDDGCGYVVMPLARDDRS